MHEVFNDLPAVLALGSTPTACALTLNRVAALLILGCCLSSCADTGPASTARRDRPEDRVTSRSHPVLGDEVDLRFSQTIWSGDAHVGDRIALTVELPVKIGRVVVIPEGATARGTITLAKPKKWAGGTLRANGSPKQLHGC